MMRAISKGTKKCLLILSVLLMTVTLALGIATSVSAGSTAYAADSVTLHTGIPWVTTTETKDKTKNTPGGITGLSSSTANVGYATFKGWEDADGVPYTERTLANAPDDLYAVWGNNSGSTVEHELHVGSIDFTSMAATVNEAESWSWTPADSMAVAGSVASYNVFTVCAANFVSNDATYTLKFPDKTLIRNLELEGATTTTTIVHNVSGDANAVGILCEGKLTFWGGANFVIGASSYNNNSGYYMTGTGISADEVVMDNATVAAYADYPIKATTSVTAHNSYFKTASYLRLSDDSGYDPDRKAVTALVFTVDGDFSSVEYYNTTSGSAATSTSPLTTNHTTALTAAGTGSIQITAAKYSVNYDLGIKFDYDEYFDGGVWSAEAYASGGTAEATANKSYLVEVDGSVAGPTTNPIWYTRDGDNAVASTEKTFAGWYTDEMLTTPLVTVGDATMIYARWNNSAGNAVAGLPLQIDCSIDVDYSQFGVTYSSADKLLTLNNFEMRTLNEALPLEIKNAGTELTISLIGTNLVFADCSSIVGSSQNNINLVAIKVNGSVVLKQGTQAQPTDVGTLKIEVGGPGANGSRTALDVTGSVEIEGKAKLIVTNGGMAGCASTGVKAGNGILLTDGTLDVNVNANNGVVGYALYSSAGDIEFVNGNAMLRISANAGATISNTRCAAYVVDGKVKLNEDTESTVTTGEWMLDGNSNRLMQDNIVIEFLKTIGVNFYTEAGGNKYAKKTLDAQGNIDGLPEEPTKTGYYFDGWYESTDAGVTLSATEFDENGTYSGPIAVYAKWQVESYTIVFVTDGGEAISNMSVNYAQTVTLPTPTKTGYYPHASWLKAAGNTSAVYGGVGASYVVGDLGDHNASVNFYVKWIVKSYVIEYWSYNNELSRFGIDYGDNVTLRKYGITGGGEDQVFVGWYDAVDATYNGTGNKIEWTVMPDAGDDGTHIKLYAKWIDAYVVRFSLNGGDGTAPTKIVLTPGSANMKATEPSAIPTRGGYTFGGWYGSDDGGFILAAQPFDFENTDITESITLYAKWNIESYTINFVANGGDGAADAITKNYSAPITLPVLTKTGYSLDGWYDADGTGDVWGDKFVYTAMPDLGDNGAQITLYAKWTENSYNVTLNENGGEYAGGYVEPISRLYTASLTLPTATNITRTGYTFAGWFESDLLTGTAVTEIAANTASAKTYYAKWEIESYTINFIKNIESEVIGDISAITQNYGTSLTLPTSITTVGYTFEGWYDADGTGDAWGNKVTYAAMPDLGDNGAQITLYAKWNIESYTINFTVNGGSGTADAITEEYGEAIALPVLTKTGYGFDGWYDADGAGDAWGNKVSYTAMPDLGDNGAQITLYAKWNIESYTINFTVNGGSGTANAITEEYGEAIALPVLTKTGYGFDGWYDADGAGDAWGNKVAYTAMPDLGDDGTQITLYAKWNIESYTIIWDGNAGADGTVTPISNTVQNYDTDLTLPTPEYTPTGANAQLYFMGWYLNAAGTGDKLVAGKLADLGDDGAQITYYAKWINGYPVTFVMNGHGAQVDGQIVVPNGANQKATRPTAPTDTGYSFVDWCTSEDGGATLSATAYDFNGNVTASLTLYAKWTENSYNVTLNENGGAYAGGYVEPISRLYTASLTLPTATNITRTGYTFAGWFESDLLTGTAVTEIAANTSSAKIYYAKWTENSYGVTLNENGGEYAGGYVEPISRLYTASLTLPTATNITRTGYTFAGWFESDLLTGTAVTEIAANTASAKVFYAKWTATNPVIATIEGTKLPDGTYNVSYASGTTPAVIATISTGGTIKYYCDDLPAGLAINELTGIISGTPELAIVNKSITVKVTGIIPNAFATVGLTITINKANITGITAPNVVTTYDGTAKTITVGGTISGDTVTYSATQNGTYTAAQPNCVTVGEYTVWYNIHRNANYNDYAASATITINKANISAADIVVSGNEYVYDGEPHTITVTSSGYQISYSIAENGTYGAHPYIKDIGEYTVWVKATRANYNDYYVSAVLKITGTKEETFNVSITIYDNDGNPLPDAVVVLKAGANIYFTGVSDNLGKVTVANLAARLYNIVVVYTEAESRISTTTTKGLDLKADAQLSITMPALYLNSIVDVKEDVPEIVVEGLADEFTDADKAEVNDDTFIEIKMTVDAVETPSERIVNELNGYTIGFTVDINVLKTKTVNNVDQTPEAIKSTNGLITIVIPLPTEYQGKARYTILREHEGIVSKITEKANGQGEYFELSEDKTTITMYVKNFSQYAITYNTANCVTHWLIIIVLLAYLAFALVWFFIFENKRFGLISLSVTLAYVVIMILLAILSRCIICLIAELVGLLVLLFVIWLFTKGKETIEKGKKKRYEKHPEKREKDEEKAKIKLASAEEKFVQKQIKKKQAAEKKKLEAQNASKQEGETAQAAEKANEQPAIKKTAETAETADADGEVTTERAAPASAIAKTDISAESAKSLSESMALIHTVTIESNVVSKAILADYLEEKYTDKVITNRRSNFISTGLPLADTHYTLEGAASGKLSKLIGGKCFVYVYELVGKKVLLLLKTNAEQAEKIAEKHNTISRSRFPKNGEWYSVVIDDSFTKQEVFDMLDKAKTVTETPIEPKTPTQASIEPEAVTKQAKTEEAKIEPKAAKEDAKTEPEAVKEPKAVVKTSEPKASAQAQSKPKTATKVPSAAKTPTKAPQTAKTTQAKPNAQAGKTQNKTNKK